LTRNERASNAIRHLQRRRLLDYLHTKDLGRYQAVTKKLKLRK